jgi:hypothetical protein
MCCTKKTKQNCHVIPCSQIREFLRPGGPDYAALIKACLQAPKEESVKPKVKKKWF